VLGVGCGAGTVAWVRPPLNLGEAENYCFGHNPQQSLPLQEKQQEVLLTKKLREPVAWVRPPLHLSGADTVSPGRNPQKSLSLQEKEALYRRRSVIRMGRNLEKKLPLNVCLPEEEF
jgi:outer membrane lipopolysaccharide assembly protein LptE/RlpB